MITSLLPYTLWDCSITVHKITTFDHTLWDWSACDSISERNNNTRIIIN
jgi:hypothetical protein